jgi:Flp pilus assembly protein TadG
MIRDALLRLLLDKRANVATIFAIAIVPTIFLTGMGMDYASAVDRRAQLKSAADAAALAAVTPTMMAESTAAATTAAQNAFNAQAEAISGVVYNPANLNVVVATSATGLRVVTVTYTAASQNAFPSVLGADTIAIGDSSQAVAGMSPNIDFYLLLDDSPSMTIAATQADINTMVNATPQQGGCAFGCHESNPAADNLGNPNGEDNYALANSLGVTLRITLLQQAAQNLMTTAQTTEATNTASYRMAIYTFDAGFNTIAALTSDLGAAETAAGNINPLQVYDQGWLTSTNNNNDTDTNYDNAMTSINTIMPNPGSGTNAPGDTPQEVLFFVTDGVEDEMVSGNRTQSLMDNGWCSTIKNRGVRIAILYTQYLPLPTNQWYNTYIAPFQANIGPTLQNCASPGLYHEVKTGGDISAALASLFQASVQSAYLAK